MPRLHQDEGGHTFNRGVVFPIEEHDDPLETPESAAHLTLCWSCIAVALLVLACWLAVALGFPISLPFN